MQTGDLVKTKYNTFGVITDDSLRQSVYEVDVFGGLFPASKCFLSADEMQEVEVAEIPDMLRGGVIQSLINVIREMRANTLPF